MIYIGVCFQTRHGGLLPARADILGTVGRGGDSAALHGAQESAQERHSGQVSNKIDKY